MQTRSAVTKVAAWFRLECFGFVVVAALQVPPPVTIYVGPALRDGFVDVDRGVLDSIEDVKKEIGKDRARFRLLTSRGEATLVLTVTSREIGGPNGGVGSQAGGVTVLTAIPSVVLRATLSVGAYSKSLVRTDEGAMTWGHAATLIVRDVAAWVDANRTRLGGSIP